MLRKEWLREKRLFYVKAFLLITLVAAILILWWLYGFSKLRHAFDLSLSDTEHTLYALSISGISYTLQLWLNWRKEGWNKTKKHILSDAPKSLFSVAAFFWAVFFIKDVVYPPPEKYSTKEIQEYSQGLVLALSSGKFPDLRLQLKKGDPAPPMPAFNMTGFWVDKRGYIATCFQHKERPSSLLIDEMAPPGSSKYITVLSTVLTSVGYVVSDDLETGLTIICNSNNPFAGGFTSRSEWTEGNKTEIFSKETPMIAVLSKNIPVVGIKLVTCPITIENGSPVVPAVEGQVIRTGYTGVVGKPVRFRIYTSIPFKESYRGAPVMDETRSVIGLISDGDQNGMCVVIPSVDIIKLIPSDNGG